jgi:hypothetical protein
MQKIYTNSRQWVINDPGLSSRATKSGYKDKTQRHSKVSTSKQQTRHPKGCQWKEGTESIRDGSVRETNWHKAVKISWNLYQLDTIVRIHNTCIRKIVTKKKKIKSRIKTQEFIN